MARMFSILPDLLGFGLVGLAAISMPASAIADGHPSCALLLQSAVAKTVTPNQLQVVKTQKSYRTQERPYALIPEGATLWVRAPEGTTAADLHRRLSTCAKQTDGTGTPICVPGARFSVDREHDLYVVHVKSEQRSSALEIQRRAERF